ncbi:MAG: zinc ribbon domain-containing protein [Candidatus Sumerlaeia bacterium]|nr:zinc ribbon domain-containing protein [Candidatus Sumerlaeia bacterium]
MPTYDYECTACGKTFEVSQRMSEPALSNCLCEEKGPVKRLLNGGTGLIFKGSGFYITDYKNGGSSPSKSEPSTETKSDTKKESAPAPASSCGQGACPACSD